VGGRNGSFAKISSDFAILNGPYMCSAPERSAVLDSSGRLRRLHGVARRRIGSLSEIEAS